MNAFARVVRAEWTKLVSVRSSLFVLFGLPLVLTALAALIGWNNRERQSTVTEAAGGGFLIFALAVGIFGVLLMTGEHGSGLIRSTLLAVPRRLPVLWAKAVVLAAAATPCLLAGYLGSFLAHQAFALSPLSLGVHEVLAVLGAAGATVAAALCGLAVGTLLPWTGPAISVFVAGLVLLPHVLIGALPAGLRDAVVPWLPTSALQGMFGVRLGDAPMLPPGWSALLALGWVILLLSAAAITLRRRDL